jgi:hypothetical protein
LENLQSRKNESYASEEAVASYKEDDLQYYLGIFRSLTDEFKESNFVLIFDQFEGVGQTSTEFFLNFAKLVASQQRFGITVSFRTDDRTWNDSTIKTVYKELEQIFCEDLSAKKMEIQGLSAEDIGKWIKQVRDISLPLNPDVQSRLGDIKAAKAKIKKE